MKQKSQKPKQPPNDMSDTFILDETGLHPIDVADIGCKICGYLDCVCEIKKDHLEGCQYRTAKVCPVGVECDHGYDVCPICDPCTCENLRNLEERGLIKHA